MTNYIAYKNNEDCGGNLPEPQAPGYIYHSKRDAGQGICDQSIAARFQYFAQIGSRLIVISEWDENCTVFLSSVLNGLQDLQSEPGGFEKHLIFVTADSAGDEGSVTRLLPQGLLPEDPPRSPELLSCDSTHRLPGPWAGRTSSSY